MVDCTNSTGVTLDCLYSYDPGDVKLVVRWFHNDSPEPIYQWIPEPDIRYVGQLIKPYFDMDFQVNNDRYSKYRALRLNSSTLPVTLSGNYSCVISSIANQDSRQGSMILYGKSKCVCVCVLSFGSNRLIAVPPKRFEFRFIETSHDQVALQCIAEGVYPKPRLSFSIRHQTNHSNYQQFPKVKVNVVASDRVLYSASFRHPIQSVLSAGTVYTCQLDLPGTTYIRKKRIKIIFPTSEYFIRHLSDS